MKWSLQQLKKINSFPYAFETIFDLSGIVEVREDVYETGPVNVKGNIIRIDEETYQFDFNINAVFSMACSLTLDPVDYHMDEDFSEVYSTKDNEDWYKIEKNTIDLFEMVWSNVIMNLPIRVVREDAYEILASRGIALEQEDQE